MFHSRFAPIYQALYFWNTKDSAQLLSPLGARAAAAIALAVLFALRVAQAHWKTEKNYKK
jgi:hypothetical protein